METMKKLLIFLIPIMIGCNNADHAPNTESEDYQFIVAMAMHDTTINCDNPIIYKGAYEYIVNERGEIIARYHVNYDTIILMVSILFLLVGILIGGFIEGRLS